MTNIMDSVNPVSNINKVNTNNQEDIKRLVKYVNNEALQNKPDTFTSTTKSAAKSSVLWEGIPFIKLLRRNKKLNGKMFSESMKTLSKNNIDAFEKLKSGQMSILDYSNYADQSKETLQAIKKAAKKEFQEKGFSKLYNGKQAIKKGVKTVKNAITSLGPVKKVINVKNSAVNGIKTFRSNLSKKIIDSIGKKAAGKAAGQAAGQSTLLALGSGAEAAEQTTLITLGQTAGKAAGQTAGKAAGKASLKKLLKSSGAGVILAISGIIEGATEVLPTYRELGKEKGRKQLVKSAVKVTGDTAGFVVGGKVGTTLGTAAGTWAATKIAAATGTAICPGIGTAIGAVCGFVGGLLGSFIMGKVTKKITGKSEREKAKEALQQQQIEQNMKNNEELEKLKVDAAQKIADEYEQTGTLSQDSQLALASLQNLEQVNPFVA